MNTLKIYTNLTKILRYLIFTPIDVIRSLPFLLLIGLPSQVGLFKISESKGIIFFHYLFLFKKPSLEDVDWLLNILKKYQLNYIKLVLSFFQLPQNIENKIFKTSGNKSHHLARIKIVEHLLPNSENILDLGGSSTLFEQGALLSMGYPFIPKSITIIDLPPQSRTYDQLSLFKEEKTLNFNNIKINYLFRSMDDFSGIANESYDLVWSGQSIEHITQTQMKKVIKEVSRVLKKGGYFCFDTPNFNVSKMLTRIGYLHPEHKIEYSPSHIELLKTLQENGFEIEKKLAVSPLSKSVKWKKFCKIELIDSTDLSDKVDDGFSFYFQCRKIDSVAKN